MEAFTNSIPAKKKKKRERKKKERKKKKKTLYLKMISVKTKKKVYLVCNPFE